MLESESRTFFSVSHWSNLQPQSYVMKVYFKQIVYIEWFKFFFIKIKKKYSVSFIIYSLIFKLMFMLWTAVHNIKIKSGGNFF